MKPDIDSFPARTFLLKIAAVAAIGASSATAAPIGLNFYGPGGREGDKKGTIDAGETAFGVNGTHWANIELTFVGNPAYGGNEGSTTLNVDGKTLNVEWATGSLLNPVTRDHDSLDNPEARLLNFFARNYGASGETPSRITISGLSSLTSGYTVRVLGAYRDGGTLNPVTLTSGTAEQLLPFNSIPGITFEAPGYASATAGITPSSPTFDGDTLVIETLPDGGGFVSGIAGIIIEPPSVVNAFDSADELDGWELLTKGRAGEEDPPTGYEGSSLSHSTGLEPEYIDSYQVTPHADGLWSTDSDQNTQSGSLKVTARNDSAGTNTSFAIVRHFDQPLDLTAFEKFEFDLLFSPTSSRRRFGNYGVMNVELLHADGNVTLKSLNESGGETNSTSGIPGSEGGIEDYKNQWQWQRITADLRPEAESVLSAVTGIRITNSLNYEPLQADVYFDNFRFVSPLVENPAAPTPELTIEKAKSGLLFTLASPDPEIPLEIAQYQNIRTQAGDYTWINRASEENPVTYSFTIGAYPGQVEGFTGQFESHIYIVPEVEGFPWTHNPNITHPHAIRLTLNGTSSTAWAHLGYKIDMPDADGYWETDNGLNGQLGSVSRPSVIGTWSLRFTSNSTISLIAPNGAAQTWDILIPDYTGVEGAPPTVVDAFSGPISIYFGSGVRDAQGLHHLEARDSSLFTNISITGVPVPVSENFTGSPDPSLWDLSASVNPAAITPLATVSGSCFWLHWNRLATGYSLQESPDLSADSWQASETSIQSQEENRIGVLKLPNKIPPTRGFFRLIKP